MKRREVLKGLGLTAGYIIAAPTVLNTLQSCSSKEATFPAKFLDRGEIQIVTHLVDIILPVTDTPGGLDVNLPQFIDMMCEDTLQDSDKKLFHRGSRIFADQCKERFGVDADKTDKKEVAAVFSSYFDVAEEEQQRIKLMQNKNIDEISSDEIEVFEVYKFLFTVRSLSLLGYFTSEKIGTEVLNFDPIPGVYKPCIPVSEVGNAWTI